MHEGERVVGGGRGEGQTEQEEEESNEEDKRGTVSAFMSSV
jgi:hypothetical protein